MTEETTNEIWKDIPGYENLYQASSLGRVKSLERKVKYKNSYRTVIEKLLKPGKSSNGYLTVALSKEGKVKNIMVHRIVCDAFLSNPDNLPDVNHRNEIKTDNRLENLEYCDSKYNNNYGSHNERVSKSNTNNPKRSKKVLCVETGKIYPSIKEVKRQLGFDNSRISACCKKKYGCKTVKGFHFEYVD